MKNYSAASGVLSFLEVIGWLTVALAAVVAVAGIVGVGGRPDPVAGILAALPVALAGVLLAAVAQMGKAQIDTAQNTGRMVELLKAQADAATRAAPEMGARPVTGGAVSSEFYRGKTIYRTADGYAVGAQIFETLDAAKDHINTLRGDV